MSVILNVINSGHAIHAQRFGDYRSETAQLYLALYSWYHMPSTMHKVLIHGAEIVRSAIVPLGALSEEAQETSNRLYKEYRQFHARKFSRQATNMDILRMFLARSDPVIVSVRNRIRRRDSEYSDDMKYILMLDEMPP